MTAAGLVKELRARGVTLVADDGVLRCRPKSALSESDLAALRAMKSEVLAALAATAPPRRLTCFSCRGRRFWISIHGATNCVICHPPADASLVAKWTTTNGGVGA